MESLLNDIQTPTDYGASITVAAANAFKSVTTYSASKEVLENWRSFYKTPENCKELCVPEVNHEIWSGLPSNVKASDIKYQNLQQHLNRAQLAHACLMDRMLTTLPKEALPYLLEPLLDSAKSVAMSMQNINQRRKLGLKSFIKPELEGLCSSKVPVTTKLFGDNLDQAVKEVKASSSILRPAGSSPSPRFQPYNRPVFRNNNLNSFRPSPGYPRGGLNFRGKQQTRFRPVNQGARERFQRPRN